MARSRFFAARALWGWVLRGKGGRAHGLRRAHLLAFALLALVSVLSNLLLTAQVEAARTSASLLNVAGQQRTLAQRVAWNAERLASTGNPGARRDLGAALTLFRQSHTQLVRLRGAGALDRDASLLDAQVEAFTAAAGRVLAVRRPSPQSPDVRFLTREARVRLLASLDAAVTRDQRHNEAALVRIERLGWVRVVFMLTLLLVLGLFVFRPLERELRAALSSLRRERDLATHVMGAMGQGLALTDHEHRLTYVNAALAALLGHRPEEVLGRHASELVAAEGPPGEVPGQGSSTLLFLRHRQGHQVPALVASVPHVTPQGTGTISVFTDLSDRLVIERALERSARYAHALLEVSRLVDADLAPERLARRAVELVAETAGVDWGGLVVLREGGAEILPVWASAGGAGAVQAVLHAGARGPVWDAHHGQEAIYLTGGAYAAAEPGRWAAGLRSGAWVPLARVDGTSFLLVAARLGEAGPWTAEDRALLGAAARSVNAALERRARLRELEAAALLDPLTGLPNRRAFERDLGVLHSGARRHGEVFGVLIIDMDGLKGVNDTRGHAQGDLLLRAFASALRATFRTEDGVYRLGGDEYAVLLARTGRAHVEAVLGRVRRALAGTAAAGFPGASASAGAAFFPEDGMTAAALVELADERMYEDKEDRRLLRGREAGARVPHAATADAVAGPFCRATPGEDRRPAPLQVTGG